MSYINSMRTFFIVWSLMLSIVLGLNSSVAWGQEDASSGSNNATDIIRDEARKAGMDKKIEMSVAECVGLALRNNVSIHIAYLNRVIEKYDLETNTDFRYMPRIGIDSTLRRNDSEETAISGTVGVAERLPSAGDLAFVWDESRTDSSITDGSSFRNTDRRNSWKVVLTQPLLKGAGFDYEKGTVQQIKLTDQQAILSLKQTLIDQVTTAITLYRSLLAAKYSMEISESSLVIAEKNLEKAQTEVKYGRIPTMEIIQYESDVANRELSLMQAKKLFINARLALAKHLELDKSLLIIPTESLEIDEIELDEQKSFKLALDNRPAYLKDLLSIESQQISLMQAERDELPNLSLTGSYGQDRSKNSEGFVNGKENDWSIGLGLSIPLYGSERRNLTRAVLGAKRDLRVAEIQLEKQKDDIASDVADKIRDIDIIEQTVELARRARILAQGKLNIEQSKMQYGKSSTFELVTFQDHLFMARIDELSRHIEYLNALNGLDQYLGTTLETWQIEFKDQRSKAEKEIREVN